MMVRDGGGDERARINISWPRRRLFIGNIPKAKSREQLYEEFSKRTRNQNQTDRFFKFNRITQLPFLSFPSLYLSRE